VIILFRNENKMELILELLASGADTTIQDNDGWNFYMHAIGNRELTKYLLFRAYHLDLIDLSTMNEGNNRFALLIFDHSSLVGRSMIEEVFPQKRKSEEVVSPSKTNKRKSTNNKKGKKQKYNEEEDYEIL
jgi:hypothetical protein